jgi:hypothetical protein
MSLSCFARRLAEEAGIARAHWSAVVARAEGALAMQSTPLGDGQTGLTMVTSLDGIEREIEAARRALVRRVVERALVDHREGVLERRIT